MPPSANRYYLQVQNLPTDPVDFKAIDLHAETAYEWGADFYVDVFRAFEAERRFSGLTVFMSYYAPESLPVYDPSVVLVVFGDESFVHRPYFQEIGCVLRAYSLWPPYLDGFPTLSLHRAALIHYLYKSVSRLASVRPRFAPGAWLNLNAAARKTTHIPIGSFRRFEPVPKPMSARTIDYAFLGSVAFDDNQRKLAHRLFTSPKVLSRRQMLEGLKAVGGGAKGNVATTGDFEVSIKNPDDYVNALSDTKISLVPRGTSYETYRFFESFKAGCVVICDPLPDEWCYEGHPGIVIRDWRKLPGLIAELIADPARLEALSAEGLAYWQRRASEPAVAAYIADVLARTLPTAAIAAIPEARPAAE